MLIKRKDLILFYSAIKSIDPNVKYSKWFSLGIMNNEEKLMPIVKTLHELAKPSEEYLEYETKRNELILKYADRNENNEIITTNKLIKIADKYKEIAKEEFEKLDFDHKEIIELRNNDLKDYSDILETEIDVDIETVDFKYFPDELNKNTLKALKPMIKNE